MNLKGLIYCRVSSQKQVKEGNGLSSQEQKCMSYAENVLGIQVEKVFNDEGISGGVFERKSIKELIGYIDSNKQNNYTVIFEDLNRLSRDIQVHHLLRTEFRNRGVELQCPNFQFEETPEGTFRENMSVSMAQYEKEKNKQRVLSRQKARLEQGFWCFPVPIGYKFIENTQGGGKLVIEDKSYSKIVKSALEKYANDELVTINDVVRFLHKKGVKVGTIKNGKVRNSNLVSRMAKNILYTGNLEFPSWGVSLRKARHKALISMKTYEAIQKKLNSNSQSIVSKIQKNFERCDINEDFPLRGFLYCEESKKMMSASWSKGRSTKVPYYTYPRNSPMYGKSINREVLHKDFDKLLKNLTPKEDVMNCFEKIFLDLLKNRKIISIEQEKKQKKKIDTIEIKINNFIERIGNTTNERLIDNYESKVDDLEKEKQIILQKMSKNISQLKNVRTRLKEKLKLVSNALQIWNSGNLENKKSLLKMIFPEGIPINKKRVVRTPSLSLIYQAFELSKVSNVQMVEYVSGKLNSLSG